MGTIQAIKARRSDSFEENALVATTQNSIVSAKANFGDDLQRIPKTLVLSCGLTSSALRLTRFEKTNYRFLVPVSGCAGDVRLRAGVESCGCGARGEP
jgi:hypothetical protein